MNTPQRTITASALKALAENLTDHVVDALEENGRSADITAHALTAGVVFAFLLPFVGVIVVPDGDEP